MVQRISVCLICVLVLAACVPASPSRLVIEEHLLSGPPDLSTDQLVFHFAQGGQEAVLAKTAPYRDFREQYNEYNRQALAPFGYALKDQAEPAGAGYVSIYQGDKLIAKDALFLKPVSVNASQTDFLGFVQLPNEVYTFSRTGLMVLPRPPGMEMRGYVGDKLLYTELSDVSQGVSHLRVYVGSDVVYNTDFNNTAVYGAFDGPWTYGKHWALVLLDAKPDAAEGPQAYNRLIVDGQDVNAAKGYEQSFQFSLLGGEPFYFYQKDGKIGISYDGQEIAKGYDEIPHYNCCTESLTNPRSSLNAAWFFARRGSDWYYVEAYIPAGAPQ